MRFHVLITLHLSRRLIGLLGCEAGPGQQPGLNNKSNLGPKGDCLLEEARKAKDVLMRVGFEPTPFRTSDCSEPEGITLS